MGRKFTLALMLLPALLGTCSCNQLNRIGDDRNIEVANQISRLQIAILEDAGVSTSDAEHSALEAVAVSNSGHGPGAGQTRIAVIAVVDQFLFDNAAPEDGADEEGSGQADREAALRRERQIRQAVNARVVRNSLLAVVQPAGPELDLARSELIANDSTALSQQLAIQLGEALQVDYIINVICDREGQDVDIVAQHSADGAIVFQETRDWSGRLRMVQETAEE